MKNFFKLIYCFLSISPVHAGIYEPHTLWDKQNLVTCFFSDESDLQETTLESSAQAKSNFGVLPKKLSRSKKKKVREATMRDFTPARTGIHFSGFKDCSETQNPDVIIMKAGAKFLLFNDFKWGGMATIGENGLRSFKPNIGRGYFEKRKQPSYVILKSFAASVIVHEFGHVAGLRHEHINPEAMEDKNCHNRRSQLDMSQPEKLEKAGATAVFHTEYDSNSIMNYCHMTVNFSQINRGDQQVLSTKDVETLKEMYPL
jgi:hypothetical protein